jgi:uncharacterized protein YjiS (DUF1127 family)
MSTIASHSPSLPATSMSEMRLFARMGQRAFSVIRAWQMSMRQRRELSKFNDVELRELSLTAADINREFNRPFWESVYLTGR